MKTIVGWLFCDLCSSIFAYLAGSLIMVKIHRLAVYAVAFLSSNILSIPKRGGLFHNNVQLLPHGWRINMDQSILKNKRLI